MSWSKTEINQVKNLQTSSVYKFLTAPVVAIAGLMTNILPSMAVTDSFYVNSNYYNDYRVCAAQLLNVGVSASRTAEGCATSIRPKDLSECVTSIKKRTKIGPVDALNSCKQARRPKELAVCVVSISNNTENQINPAVLDYCGRSLLPITYALCVVGLRKEINLEPVQALNTCIDASDRAGGIIPSSLPPSKSL